MGVSENRRTQKKVPLIFGNSHIGMSGHWGPTPKTVSFQPSAPSVGVYFQAHATPAGMAPAQPKVGFSKTQKLVRVGKCGRVGVSVRA